MPPIPAPFEIDGRTARYRADQAARGYLEAARLEQEVGARMLERLDYVKLAPRRILDAGSGPSPQAAQLMRRYPKAEFIALDYSLAMLLESKPRTLLERLSGRGRREAVCADFGQVPLTSRSVSLLWSNMAVHWATDVPTALLEFHRVLEIDGLLMFSTLGPDTLRELRSAVSALGGPPRVHGFIDMHDLGDMLVAAGFDAPVMDVETITLTYANVEAMIADLRGTGQTSAIKSRSRGLLGPKRWQLAKAALERGMREGRLPATVEVVYGHAWKPVPRVSGEGHAIVALPKSPRMQK